MKKIFGSLLLLISCCAHAQHDSSSSNLGFSGYAEVYYNYNFNDPAHHAMPSFMYSYNRHNEFTLNLGYLKAGYQYKNIHANLAFGTGTYMNANLASEPGVLKNIFEANVGIKISKKQELWVDAGIFASHIGFESAVGKDCWNLTRSILADNTPYYESGVKISYTSKDGKWFLSGLLLNGWQHIVRPDGNNTPAFGHQLTYKPNDKITINSSSFIGNDKPDSARQMRYFHNFYSIFQFTPKLGLTAGFDIGAEQKSKGSKSFNCWYSPVIILKISTSSKSSLAGRLEFYNDKNQVIIQTGTLNGFQTWGYSMNYDLAVNDHVLWRLEARGFSGKDKTFDRNGIEAKNDFFLATSLSIGF